MARLSELLGHDPNDRRTPLGEKLLARTTYERVSPENFHECNRFSCREGAVLWFQSGHAPRRYLCRDHVIAIVSDMTGAEEKSHVEGLPELLTDMLEKIQ